MIEKMIFMYSLIFIGACLVGIVAKAVSPEGYQDELGFRCGRPPWDR